MKRAIPLLLVAVVVAACGSGRRTGLGSDVIDYRPHVPRSSVTPLANRRERKAGQEAERLLQRVPLPPGASRLRHAPPVTDPLSQSGLGVSTVNMTADRHSLWRVPGSAQATIAFERQHMLSGLRGEGAASSPNGWASEEWFGPSVGGRPVQREVSVTVEPYNGGLALRLDAGISWIYPRSPQEVVPAGVREIDVRDEKVERRVTDPAEVGAIVRWFDALHVSQPGPAVGCALAVVSQVRLVFRSSGGARLASALLPSQPATNCDSISFSIHGKPQWSLIDATNGKGAFVERIQRLLGVRFPCPASAPKRACR